jgi:hypothetical protein
MFFRRDSTVGMWRIIFRPRGASVSFPRVIHFRQTEKVSNLFARYGTNQEPEGRAALECGFKTRRGAVELELSEEQTQHLRAKARPRAPKQCDRRQ